METRECILKRRSIRKFENKKISDEQIKDLLVAAMAAPSARNKQPWQFYVIKNSEVLNKIRTFQPRFNYNSDIMILVCADLKLAETTDSNGFYNQDCSAAVENMMLEGTNIGLGSVWCGVYPRVDSVNFFKEVLDIKEDHILPFALIHFGYPAEEKEPLTYYNEDRIHVI